MPIPDLSSREPIPASADDDRIPPPESDPRGPSLRSSPPSYSSSVFSRDSRDLSPSPRQTLVHYQRIPRGVASPSVAVLSFALPHNFNFQIVGFCFRRFISRMYLSVLPLLLPLFLFVLPISAPPFSLSSQSSDDSAHLSQFLATFSPNPSDELSASSSSNPALPSQNVPTWLAIERVPFSADNFGGDAVLLRTEHCSRHCAEVLGSDGAVAMPRVRCLCRCPSGYQIFVQTAEGGGKCAAKAPDCPGRTFRFDRPSDNGQTPIFAPVLGIPRKGEALSNDLRIAWRENGVKVRAGHGPRCAIQSAFLLATQAIWRPLDGDLFKLGWTGGEGRVIWTGNEKDAEELAGGIVQLVLECAAGKSGNGSFCVAFRVEGQIESPFAPREEDSTVMGDVGAELDRARRAEVVAIILLAILLFLSVFSSIFLWNVCWRMEKRKLIHSLQLQFLHYAKQEKDKTIAECQLRYQALVKAAAGVQQQKAHGTAHPHIGIANGGILNGANGGGMTATDGGESDGMGGTELAAQQLYQQRRKLYFSAEFFEPHLMSNPPPMAEQFLYDLRKMVAMARERIRTRRHVPRLHAIVESDDEGGTNGGNEREQQKYEKIGREADRERDERQWKKYEKIEREVYRELEEREQQNYGKIEREADREREEREKQKHGKIERETDIEREEREQKNYEKIEREADKKKEESEQKKYEKIEREADREKEESEQQIYGKIEREADRERDERQWKKYGREVDREREERQWKKYGREADIEREEREQQKYGREADREREEREQQKYVREADREREEREQQKYGREADREREEREQQKYGREADREREEREQQKEADREREEREQQKYGREADREREEREQQKYGREADREREEREQQKYVREADREREEREQQKYGREADREREEREQQKYVREADREREEREQQKYGREADREREKGEEKTAQRETKEQQEKKQIEKMINKTEKPKEKMEQFTDEEQFGMDVWKRIKQFSEMKQHKENGKGDEKTKQYRAENKKGWREMGNGKGTKQYRKEEKADKEAEEKQRQLERGENGETEKGKSNGKEKKEMGKDEGDMEKKRLENGKQEKGKKKQQDGEEGNEQTEEEKKSGRKEQSIGIEREKGTEQPRKSEEKEATEKKQRKSEESAGREVGKKLKPSNCTEEKQENEGKKEDQANNEKPKQNESLEKQSKNSEQNDIEEKPMEKLEIGKGEEKPIESSLERRRDEKKVTKSDQRNGITVETKMKRIEEMEKQFEKGEKGGEKEKREKEGEEEVKREDKKERKECETAKKEDDTLANGATGGQSPSVGGHHGRNGQIGTDRKAEEKRKEQPGKTDAGTESAAIANAIAKPSPCSARRGPFSLTPFPQTTENLSDDDTSTTPSSNSGDEGEREDEDLLINIQLKNSTEMDSRKFAVLSPAPPAAPSSTKPMMPPSPPLAQHQQQQIPLVHSRIPIGVASTSGTVNNGSKLPRAMPFVGNSPPKQRTAAIAVQQPQQQMPSTENGQKTRTTKSLLQQPNGHFSLNSMKRRAATAQLKVERGGDEEGTTEKGHGRTPLFLNNSRSAVPSSLIPCPTSFSASSPAASSVLLPPPPFSSSAFPSPPASSYVVSPPDNHFKKSLPRRKKLNSANGGTVPSFAANGGGMATNLKMPTVV
ncbi:hypothetical protein niasHT_037663 [Heterodera trifolii]|uniref:Uncharacterized protein n=1 Tax=Heterodera trifolii TaxID=157864 RepID=A0ABD2IIZ4_9BILA